MDSDVRLINAHLSEKGLSISTRGVILPVDQVLPAHFGLLKENMVIAKKFMQTIRDYAGDNITKVELEGVLDTHLEDVYEADAQRTRQFLTLEIVAAGSDNTIKIYADKEKSALVAIATDTDKAGGVIELAEANSSSLTGKVTLKASATAEAEIKVEHYMERFIYDPVQPVAVKKTWEFECILHRLKNPETNAWEGIYYSPNYNGDYTDYIGRVGGNSSRANDVFRFLRENGINVNR